jgi:hypothetical protein
VDSGDHSFRSSDYAPQIDLSFGRWYCKEPCRTFTAAQKFDLCSWTSRKSVFDENKITKININTALTVVDRRQQNFKMLKNFKRSTT